jgi:hypothetical protein
MIITISKPDDQFYRHVNLAASHVGCYASIKWNTDDQVRFTLVDRPTSDMQATFQQHDDVIARLFMADPHATIRTAKAVFKGAADFYAQKQARAVA